MTTTLTIALISEAPVREGEEDLRPVLVAPVRTENGRSPAGMVGTGTICKAAEYSSRSSTACCLR
jgi:hypothetical protein